MGKKMKFKYFYGAEADQFSFYRIPKALFTDSYFKDLSSDAKILYGLMLDRMSLPIKNQWFDEKNRAYIYFSIEDIMELLNCGRNKAIKSMQELDDEAGIGLIEKRRQGFGKVNIIYVKTFMPEKMEEKSLEDELKKFKKQTSEENEESTEVYNSNFMKSQNQTSRSPENKLQEVYISNPNNTNLSDTEMNDNKSNQIVSADENRSDGDNSTEEYLAYENLIKETVDYESLEITHMDSIMQSLEFGVEELFTSNRYQEYLKTMAKFHNYSFNNTMLIAMQRPDATLVTSYKNWQSMGRQVMKGEKGITIIAPAPYKKMKEKEVLDENQRPIMGTDGKPKTEKVEVTVPHFKAVTVFDIAQTSGEPIQTLAPELLTAAVQDFDSFMQAIQKISPVPIRFDEIDGNANGYYHNADKEIVIKKGLSESQTLKTAIHETAHAKLHDREIMESLGVEKDRLTKEVEALYPCFYNVDFLNYFP